MRNKKLCIAMLTLTLTACSNHDGLYAPVDNPQEDVKPAGEYFDC